ncbi:hypothetical protein IJ674_10350 [bacterium]|nr:hypothetical protein [bacterium]
MEIKLDAEKFNTLLKDGELFINPNHSIYLYDVGEGLKMEMNWKGYGYKVKKVTVEFECFDNIKYYFQIDFIDKNGLANYIDTFKSNELIKAVRHWHILTNANACISKDTSYVLDLYSFKVDQNGNAIENTDELVKQILPRKKEGANGCG